MSGVATLSNEKNYTVFQFENHVIRFIAPYSLERYIAVNPIKAVEVANG